MKYGTSIDIDIVSDTPDQLASMLNRGELDISAISLVDYMLSESELLLLPDIGIGSDGPILSCNIVSQSNLAQLDGRVVSICSTSRTTALLAKLLLEEKYGVSPIYVNRPPVLNQMLEGADAAVIIGDAALRAKFQDAPQRGLQVFDTGEMWHDWTGLPMVFSVWVVRRSYALTHPELVRSIHADLICKMKEAKNCPDMMVNDAVSKSNFDATIIKNYFQLLNFSLGERQLMGMNEFCRRVASRLQMPQPGCTHVFWQDHNPKLNTKDNPRF